MSLIHDALKKAENGRKASIGSGLSSFQSPPEELKKKVSTTTVILAVVFLGVIGYLVYTKLIWSGADTAALSVTAALPVVTLSATEVMQLKKSAVNAYKAEDFDTAWKNLLSASEAVSSDPEIWNNLGLVARKRGDVAKAREFYSKALALKKDYPEALNNLAALEMQSGNNDNAQDFLEQALKILPNYPEANFHLALVYDQAGNKEKAVEYYKKFLAISESFPQSVVESVRDRVMELEP